VALNRRQKKDLKAICACINDFFRKNEVTVELIERLDDAMRYFIDRQEAYQANLKPAFDKESQKHAVEIRKIRAEMKREVRKTREEAYIEGQKDLLRQANKVQWLALQKLLGQAEISPGTYDAALIDDKTMNLALKAAGMVADRAVGKPSEKRQINVTHNIYQQLEAQGELE